MKLPKNQNKDFCAKKLGLFIFRRDLRLEDNTGLIQALFECDEVIPAFIFDPAQIDRKANEYFSEPAFHFLLNSLAELNAELNKLGSRLYVFYGKPEEIVESLIKHDTIQGTYVNRDYTPFSKRRDAEIAKTCESLGCEFKTYQDYTLSPIESIKTGEGKIYTVFTPFMKKANETAVAVPQKNNHHNYFSGELQTKTALISNFTANVEGLSLALLGGRYEALKILSQPIYLNDYQDRRNIPSDVSGTSKLSAHHKFGTISIRESYQVAKNIAGAHSHYISELYWRDFYYYIAHHFPTVFSTSFLPWATHLKWVNNEEHFKKWCRGETGVPIVDAGMRQLNQTGFMHNRPRMIVASYLTKNLLIDWRWGEKYFASRLLDYDPAQNNGGWQWSASTGADPKPIRIFNPYIQATNYDPDAEYIKKWVPELANVSSKLLTDGKTENFGLLAPGYPAPLVDRKQSFHLATEAYKNAKQQYKEDFPKD